MLRLLLAKAIDRRTALLMAALFAVALGCGLRPGAAENAEQTVRLVVDYGDGASKTIGNLAWAKGNTILDAMKAATARPHGISFSFTGQGAAAMLTKIDDVQNEGGGAGKRNWQYLVNDVSGTQSFAIAELKAQDVVVWRFSAEQGK